MAPQRHRFSQRFLTILILITCIAIVLLSRMDATEKAPSDEPTSSTQQKISSKTVDSR